MLALAIPLPATEEAALDDLDDERRRLFLAHLRIKPASDYEGEKKKKEENDLLKLSLLMCTSYTNNIAATSSVLTIF